MDLVHQLIAHVVPVLATSDICSGNAHGMRNELTRRKMLAEEEKKGL